MLPKENRLKKNSQFSYIYKHGQTKHSLILSLSFVKTQYQPFKVGFTDSKKIGKSVVRSKVKRKLREAFKLVLNKVNENYNYILIARPGIEKANFEEIKKAINDLLLKANLIKRSWKF